jgi:hypothetical protein
LRRPGRCRILKAMRSLAKKVLFLYPHSVVQGQMIDLLIQSEFEVATINDHQKAMQLINRFKGSILLVNIEDHLKDDEWEYFIRNVVQGQGHHQTLVGIMVYNSDSALAERYLIDIGVPCGFVQLKLGLMDSTRILIKALMANEAKGDRKYVRVSCPPRKAKMNIKTPGEQINGELLDISSAGFACIMEKQLENGSEFDDMQLSLIGSIMHASGKIMGHRTQEDGKDITVILFNDISRETKGKIYQFIRKTLQAEIDEV